MESDQKWCAKPKGARCSRHPPAIAISDSTSTIPHNLTLFTHRQQQHAANKLPSRKLLHEDYASRYPNHIRPSVHEKAATPVPVTPTAPTPDKTTCPISLHDQPTIDTSKCAAYIAVLTNSLTAIDVKKSTQLVLQSTICLSKRPSNTLCALPVRGAAINNFNSTRSAQLTFSTLWLTSSVYFEAIATCSLPTAAVQQTANITIKLFNAGSK